MSKKEYTGSAYIGIVGSEIELGEARDSIHNIIRRDGDSNPVFARGTKGYEARQTHINKFLESNHDFILLLDQDMKFKPDTLEKLRGHRLPFVSGLYMRRDYQPLAPVWHRPFTGKWPLEPWIGPIEKGRLHPIGASGWGCILIHREVIEATRKILHGEWEVFEDDMDVWPYDLRQILAAIKGLRSLLAERPGMSTLLPTLEQHTRTLEGQIRPLRADRDRIGSDIRFAWYATQAGYPLMGDPDVRPGHFCEYPFSADDYEMFPPDELEAARKDARNKINAARAELRQRQEAVYA